MLQTDFMEVHNDDIILLSKESSISLIQIDYEKVAARELADMRARIARGKKSEEN